MKAVYRMILCSYCLLMKKRRRRETETLAAMGDLSAQLWSDALFQNFDCDRLEGSGWLVVTAWELDGGDMENV